MKRFKTNKRQKKLASLPPEIRQLVNELVQERVMERLAQHEKNLQALQGFDFRTVKPTLHQATVHQWHKAEYTNGLRTAMDFVIAASKLELWQGGQVFNANDEAVPDLVIPLAAQLTTALTEGTRQHLDTAGHMKVSDVAMVCMAQMGWLKQSAAAEVQANV